MSERSEKQQAYSAQDSQHGDRQVPKHINWFDHQLQYKGFHAALVVNLN